MATGQGEIEDTARYGRARSPVTRALPLQWPLNLEVGILCYNTRLSICVLETIYQRIHALTLEPLPAAANCRRIVHWPYASTWLGRCGTWFHGVRRIQLGRFGRIGVGGNTRTSDVLRSDANHAIISMHDKVQATLPIAWGDQALKSNAGIGDIRL
jgi:hypothetical protein